VSRPKYNRETEQVKEAHSGLDNSTAQRVAEQCVQVARDSGTPLSEVIAETVRAENGSAAGNTSTP